MLPTFATGNEPSSADLVQIGWHHISAGLEVLDTDPSYYDMAGFLIHIGLEQLLQGWVLEITGHCITSENLCSLYQEIAEKHGAPHLSHIATAALVALSSYERCHHDLVQAEIIDHAGIEALTIEICSLVPQSIQASLSRVEPGTKAGRALMEKTASRLTGFD